MTRSKQFVTADFVAAIPLFGAGSQAPSGVTTRPRRVIVEYDVGDVLAYVDDALVTVYLVFPSSGVKMFRMRPTKLETATTCTSVTVVW